MSDKELIRDILTLISKSTEEIIEWFEGMESPEDFSSSSENRKTLNAICMNLIAIGEGVKGIDEKSEGGRLLVRHNDIHWKKVMGIRDFLAHHYYHVDEKQVFTVCDKHIPKLRKTLAKMLKEVDG